MSWPDAISMKPKLLVAFCCCALMMSESDSLAHELSDIGADPSGILSMLDVRIHLQRRATGIVVGISQPRETTVVAYGTLGLDDKRRVDGNTVFDIGSITKVFTALLLTDMVQDHEVALEDPASKYLPADRVTMPMRNGRHITLADLATHTAGLPLRPTNLTSSDPLNKYSGYSTDALFAFLSSYKLPRDPGAQYEYSNVGFGILGQVLSLRTGETYSDLLRDRITGPLGMRDTRIDATDEMKRRQAIGYDETLKPAPHWDYGALESAGALRSTANDLLKLLDAALGNRKSDLLPAMNTMLATRRPGGMEPATEIALAWNILRDGKREIAWKNGSVGGYRAFIGYDPTEKLGVVALANAQTGAGVDDIGLHLLDPNIPVDMQVPGDHKEIALSADILDRYVGVYRYSATDILTITRQGDHLFGAETGQEKFELFAESQTGFFLTVADAEVTFADVREGHATKAIWHQGGQDETGERAP